MHQSGFCLRAIDVLAFGGLLACPGGNSELKRERISPSQSYDGSLAGPSQRMSKPDHSSMQEWSNGRKFLVFGGGSCELFKLIFQVLVAGIIALVYCCATVGKFVEPPPPGMLGRLRPCIRRVPPNTFKIF